MGLHDQLIRLGDMMGDGLHHEPGGKWIGREYTKTAKALGLIPKTKRSVNVAGIDGHMKKRVTVVKCGHCQGELKQTRSGAKRAKCVSCGGLWKLLK